MGLKQWIFGHEVAGKAKEAEMGKLGPAWQTVWHFLDGWKSWVVAVVATYKLMCHSCATAGYLDSAVNALGWDTVTGAFDAGQAAMAVGVIVAIGHHLVKAVQQYRAGVPLADLHSGPAVASAKKAA